MAALLPGTTAIAPAIAPAIADAAAEPYRCAIRLAVLFLTAGLVIALRFRAQDVAAAWQSAGKMPKTIIAAK
ncbi:hypothetical protein D3C75_743280 [compost metagenome]